MKLKKNKKEIPLWAQTGHRKPVTRRELLAHGIIPFTASMFAPQFLQLLLSSRADAAPSCPEASSSLVPFVSLNLAGGAAMSGNYVPTDAGGQLLPSYDIMGLGDNALPIEKEFGGANFAGVGTDGQLISKMLQGIRLRADADTLSKTSFVAVCVRSRDDSSENEFNIAGLVSKLGLSGSRIPNMGVASTTTGVNQRFAAISPPAPLVVRSFTDIVNSLGYTAAVGAQLSLAQKDKLTRLVGNLNASQTRKLASITYGSEVQNLVECAGIKNNGLVTEGSAIVDPVGNSTYAGVWGLTTASQRNSNAYVFGSMVYNSLMGYAGSAALQIGGYDYHNNTRTTGDTRDLAAGEAMGRILQSAKVLNKPVFLYVTSDGNVVSAKSNSRNSVWTSDRGSAGVAYIMMYNPSGRPAVSSNQVGQFTAGQAADDKFVTGNDPFMAAQAVFANYLQLNKQLSQFSKLITVGALDTAALNKVVKVA